MKRLTTYISHTKDFHSLNEYLNEKLIINKNYKHYAPISFNELREIIEQRYNEQGPGTEQKPIYFNDIDVSNIDSFCNNVGNGIFEGTKFEYIDISGWNVSNVKNMNCMFANCEKFESVGDLSEWNVSNVESMSFMFYECKQLKSMGVLSNWNVSSVDNMSYMFCGCRNLKSIGDLSNWDVSNVENMSHMFDSCEKLESVGDLSNWNVSKVKYMNGIFLDSAIKNIPKWS